MFPRSVWLAKIPFHRNSQDQLLHLNLYCHDILGHQRRVSWHKPTIVSTSISPTLDRSRPKISLCASQFLHEKHSEKTAYYWRICGNHFQVRTGTHIMKFWDRILILWYILRGVGYFVCCRTLYIRLLGCTELVPIAKYCVSTVLRYSTVLYTRSVSSSRVTVCPYSVSPAPTLR